MKPEKSRSEESKVNSKPKLSSEEVRPLHKLTAQERGEVKREQEVKSKEKEHEEKKRIRPVLSEGKGIFVNSMTLVFCLLQLMLK